MSSRKKLQLRREKTRKRRKMRTRAKIKGTPERPRLSVHKSLANTYAQIIDDTSGSTLVSASTRNAGVIEAFEPGDTKSKKGYKVGLAIAKLARDKGIEVVAFDRQSAPYHGRVKAVADGAREGGLKF